jgi:cell wall assembly regulator SMI1
MTIEEEVKSLLRKAANRYGGELPPGIGKDEIDAFEHRTAIVVPASLREWLAITNGPTASDWLFGIRPKRQSLDVEVILRIYPGWQKMGWIPVANDGCGDYYVLATAPKDSPGHPVFFIENHEDIEKPKYVVASDLWHFLRFFLEDALQEDLSSEAPSWPFSREFVLRHDPALADYKNVPRPWEIADY